jgi:OHCU decarboxylase
MAEVVTRDLHWLNSLSRSEAVTELKSCCGSDRWASQLVDRRPFKTFEQLLSDANEFWLQLAPADWLEAFRSHPKIGEKKAEAAASKQSSEWSKGEQAGITNASTEVTARLADLNVDYERKFGYIFIVCATGKSSEEMLAILRERMENEPGAELRTAAAEQAKITELRLKKLLREI